MNLPALQQDLADDEEAASETRRELDALPPRARCAHADGRAGRVEVVRRTKGDRG